MEVSSFQLEDIHAFRPAAGVFLNLTPDHLDRHGTMERYLACKANLFANQGPDDVAVLNLADPAVAGLGAELAGRPDGPRVSFFSVKGAAPVAVPRPSRPLRPPRPPWRPRHRPGRRSRSLPPTPGWTTAGCSCRESRCSRSSDIRLPGVHNLENCLAAGTAALARGVEREAVAEGLRTFAGVAHRLETAGMVAGVTYVNDSKATNVEATLTALNAYPERTHLILGGRDKASDYRPVARACARGCRAVYLIGEATPLIEEAFSEVRAKEGLTGVPAGPGCTETWRRRCARRRQPPSPGTWCCWHLPAPASISTRISKSEGITSGASWLVLPGRDRRGAFLSGQDVQRVSSGASLQRQPPPQGSDSPKPRSERSPASGRSPRAAAARLKDLCPVSYHLVWVTAVVLLIAGLCMMLSVSTAATEAGGDKFVYVRQQGITAVIGLLLMLVISRLDYRRMGAWSMVFLGAGGAFPASGSCARD